jgi:hypothetical protein
MTRPSPAKKNAAKHTSEFLGAISQLIFSSVPVFFAFAMKLFEVVGKFIFMPTWGLDVMTNIGRTLAAAFSPNKNIQRIAGVVMGWTGLILSTMLMFCTAYIGATASFGLIVVMLSFAPFCALLKASWFAIKAWRSKDMETRKKHLRTVKLSLIESILMSLGAAAFATLALIPGVPAALSMTLGVILTSIIAGAMLTVLVKKFVEFGKWVHHKVCKWQERRKGLRDPLLDIKPRLISKRPRGALLNDLDSDSELAANFHSSLIQRLDQYIAAQEKRIAANGTFQHKKRKNKVHASQMLQQILQQWDLAFTDGLTTNQLHYDNMNLGDAFIENVPNIHANQYAARNKEKLIKRIRQHLFEQYPEAFQSFFNEKGEFEILFDEAMDAIRSMKSEQEITNDAAAIQEKIHAYQTSHQHGFFSLFTSNDAKAERDETTEYLEKMLAGTLAPNIPAPAAVLKKNSERNKMYQQISALRKSQDTLFATKKNVNAAATEEAEEGSELLVEVSL